MELDLAGAEAPARLIGAATAACGHLDILICNHARSGADGPLGALDAALLDGHWAVNTRSAILLAQAIAAQHDGRPGGRTIFMTSGQDLGPMPGEVAYAASKGALASITRTPGRPAGRSGHHAQHGQPWPGRHGLRAARCPGGRPPSLPARLLGYPR